MQRPYNRAGYVVRISESALIQLCLAGLEAYSVTHGRKKRRTQLETYGQTWGHELSMPDGRTFYSVEMATVDTSASRKHDQVMPNSEALELKRDLMTSFWPHMEFLGDFHTHPYKAASAVAPQRLYQFSETDREDVEERPDDWRPHGYRVGLVLTVAALQRASSRDHRQLETSAVEFTLGNYRLWLKAYVAFAQGQGLRLTDEDAEDVLLDCPALLGLTQEHTKFGRAQVGGKVGHRPGLVDMTLPHRVEG